MLPFASAAYSVYSAFSPAAAGVSHVPLAIAAAATLGKRALEIGLPAVKEAAAILRNRKAFVELVAEVNAAIKYLKSVQMWLDARAATVCPLEKAELESLLEHTWTFIQENFTRSRDFRVALQHDSKIVKILQEMGTHALEGGASRILNFGAAYYLRDDPLYYRQELAFRMVSVIELLKEMSVHRILNPAAACRELKKEYVTLESGGILVDDEEIRALLQKIKTVVKGEEAPPHSNDDASSETARTGSSTKSKKSPIQNKNRRAKM